MFVYYFFSGDTKWLCTSIANIGSPNKLDFTYLNSQFCCFSFHLKRFEVVCCKIKALL